MSGKATISQMEGTSTDLLFEYFADPSKMKPEEKQLDIPNRIDERSEDSHFHSRTSSYSKKSSRSSSSSRSKDSIKLKPTSIPSIQTNVPSLQPTFGTYAPINQPTKFPTTYIPSYNPADERTTKFKKMELLAKLNDIRQTGRSLTREYSISSEIEDMEMEIRYQTETENKKQGVDLAKNFLCYTVNVLEFMNEKFDPFGLQLRGWCDRIKMNIDNYNDVMGELYEKYKGSGRKIEPEIKLLFMIGFSAVTVHTSKAVTRSMGLEEAVKNNPELLAKLQGSFTGAFEKKVGSGPPPETKSDPIVVQREMYRKMMEEKAREAAVEAKRPPVNNLLNKLKNKIPLNVDTSKLEDTTEMSPHIKMGETSRIKSTKTLDSETDTSEISMAKIRRKRPNVVKK